jgi:hypothetical protein
MRAVLGAANIDEEAIAAAIGADPQLAAIVKAWPKLPAAVRAKIAKLASGSRKKKPSHFAKRRPR